jgi:hypothetical protein
MYLSGNLKLLNRHICFNFDNFFNFPQIQFAINF